MSEIKIAGYNPTQYNWEHIQFEVEMMVKLNLPGPYWKIYTDSIEETIKSKFGNEAYKLPIKVIIEEYFKKLFDQYSISIYDLLNKKETKSLFSAKKEAVDNLTVLLKSLNSDVEFTIGGQKITHATFITRSFYVWDDQKLAVKKMKEMGIFSDEIDMKLMFQNGYLLRSDEVFRVKLLKWILKNINIRIEMIEQRIKFIQKKLIKELQGNEYLYL